MMNLAQRIDSIEGIAAIIGRGDPTSLWFESHSKLHLRVTAGGKTWNIAANATPKAAAEDMCSAYLLRKLAHAAGVCPKCLGKVQRAASSANNKAVRKRYRCPSCLHSWRDS